MFINTHNMKGYRPCIPVRIYCTYLSPLYTLVLSLSQTTPFNDIILERLHTSVWYPSLLLESPYWFPYVLSNIYSIDMYKLLYTYLVLLCMSSIQSLKRTSLFLSENLVRESLCLICHLTSIVLDSETCCKPYIMLSAW